MNSTEKTFLNATTVIYAPIEIIWKLWTTPADIRQWNNLSDEWHTTQVDNDLRKGGRFRFVMGLKDGSFTFDFEGIYDEIIPYEKISYTLNDGRRATNTFTKGEPMILTENFEATTTEPLNLQLSYCQAVLNSFKRYAETITGSK